MRTINISLLAVLSLVFFLSGCGFMPSQGPSTGDISNEAKTTQTGHKSPNIRLIHVTPSIARKQMKRVTTAQKKAVQDTIAKLDKEGSPPAVHLDQGDTVSVKIWTVSPWPTQSGSSGSSSGGISTAPQAIKLGTFTVDSSGQIHLPYAGHIHIAGLTPDQAERRIAARYKKLGILQSPDANLTLEENKAQTITVTGSTRTPRTLPWGPGGITLSQAIVKGSGPRNAGTQSAAKNGTAHGSNRNVAVIVRHGSRYVVPLARASISNIQLMPGDKVMLESRPLARVQFLGPGTKHNRLVSFRKTPTLSRAIAEDGGLSSTAQGRSVYVLRSKQKHRPTIYKFAWDSLSGLRASHNFPLRNGDIVYVANSPSVNVRRLTDLLFKTAFPISTATTAGGL